MNASRKLNAHQYPPTGIARPDYNFRDVALDLGNVGYDLDTLYTAAQKTMAAKYGTFLSGTVGAGWTQLGTLAVPVIATTDILWFSSFLVWTTTNVEAGDTMDVQIIETGSGTPQLQTMALTVQLGKFSGLPINFALSGVTPATYNYDVQMKMNDAGGANALTITANTGFFTVLRLSATGM